MKRWRVTIPTLTFALFVTTCTYADDPTITTVKDRGAFFPSRKQVPVPAKAIGILLADGQPILSTDGRSGPADQLVFSAGGNSYRWIYVATQDNPQITNLQVPAGANGQIKQVYPALNLANPRSVVPWAITKPYTLVEIEVNGGEGSPANDSFVATSLRVIEGTKDFPLKTADVIKDVKDRYAAHMTKKKSDAVEKAMKETGEKALNGKPVTGPRERAELMYVTWLSDTNTMRVSFKTTISDGAYMYVGGGVQPGPLQRPKNGPAVRIPPRDVKVKVGTTFGLEYGLAYVINKDGKVVGLEELPIETFVRQLNMPLGIRPGLPIPLPPAPIQDAK